MRSHIEAWKFICVGDNMNKIQLFDQTHGLCTLNFQQLLLLLSEDYFDSFWRRWPCWPLVDVRIGSYTRDNRWRPRLCWVRSHIINSFALKWLTVFCWLPDNWFFSSFFKTWTKWTDIVKTKFLYILDNTYGLLFYHSNSFRYIF